MTSIPQNPASMYTLPPYQSARIRASWAIAGLIVAMAALVYQAFIDAEGFALIAGMLDGEYVSDEALEAYDAKSLSVTLWTLAGLCFSGVTFCMWVFRVSKNVSSTGRPLKMSPGWAVGSFFIPVLSLWRPYVAVANVWEMSDPDLGPGRPSPGGWLVITWWVLWVLSGFGRFGGPENVESVSDLQTQQMFSYFSTGTSLAAGALAILLVHRLTRRQEVFAERFMVPPAQVV